MSAGNDAGAGGSPPTREDLDALHRVVGEVAMFLGESKRHRHNFLSDLHWLVLPPVLLRQYKLARDSEGRTVGYVSWAFAGEGLAARLIEGDLRIRMSEWKGGDQALVVQLACPRAAEGRLLGAVKSEVFAGRSLQAVRRGGPDGKPRLMEVRMPEKEGAGDPPGGERPLS